MEREEELAGFVQLAIVILDQPDDDKREKKNWLIKKLVLSSHKDVKNQLNVQLVFFSQVLRYDFWMSFFSEA